MVGRHPAGLDHDLNRARRHIADNEAPGSRVVRPHAGQSDPRVCNRLSVDIDDDDLENGAPLWFSDGKLPQVVGSVGGLGDDMAQSTARSHLQSRRFELLVETCTELDRASLHVAVDVGVVGEAHAVVVLGHPTGLPASDPQRGQE